MARATEALETNKRSIDTHDSHNHEHQPHTRIFIWRWQIVLSHNWPWLEPPPFIFDDRHQNRVSPRPMGDTARWFSKIQGRSPTPAPANLPSPEVCL